MFGQNRPHLGKLNEDDIKAGKTIEYPIHQPPSQRDVMIREKLLNSPTPDGLIGFFRGLMERRPLARMERSGHKMIHPAQNRRPPRAFFPRHIIQTEHPGLGNPHEPLIQSLASDGRGTVNIVIQPRGGHDRPTRPLEKSAVKDSVFFRGLRETHLAY